VLGINGTENTLKPPPVIGQKATGIRDFLPHEFAKILTSAAFAEADVLLVMVVCKSLLLKSILLQELLPQSEARL
jgi:hypothetical protein